VNRRRYSLAAVGATAVAAAGVMAAVLLFEGASAPLDSCNGSIAEFRQAKRIIGPGPSYAKGNAVE